MTYDFNAPVNITDANLEEVREWLQTRKGRATKWHVMLRKRCPVCRSYLVSRKCCHTLFDAAGERIGQALGREATCPYCRVLTVEEPFIPDNDSPPVTLTPYKDDWVQCPECGKRFTLSNPSSWNGERHRTCGRRLTIHHPAHDERTA